MRSRIFGIHRPFFGTRPSGVRAYAIETFHVSNNTKFLFQADRVMPRRLYTEHKYVSFNLSEFSRFTARIDFSDNAQISEVKAKFAGIKNLMLGHAAHENERIHGLLRKKDSHVHEKIEADHAGHDAIFQDLEGLLSSALEMEDGELKKQAGYKFYLDFQRFEAENLNHQFYEETIIMPELHRLYTDQEILEQVDGFVYAQMDAEDLIGMMKELFPHFNKDDRYEMLNDIQLSQPAKFQAAFDGIKLSLSPKECEEFSAAFQGALSSTATLSDKPTFWGSPVTTNKTSDKTEHGHDSVSTSHSKY